MAAGLCSGSAVLAYTGKNGERCEQTGLGAIRLIALLVITTGAEGNAVVYSKIGR